MSYTSQAAIETLIPGPLLTNALDDDGDGVADDGILDRIISIAENAVNAYLAGIYDVPFAADSIPASVADAALIFACEMIHTRRDKTGAANTFTARANNYRVLLEKIGQGKAPLPGATRRQPGEVIAECLTIDQTMR